MTDHIDWLTEACREGTNMAELIERVRMAGLEVRELREQVATAETKRIADLEWNRSVYEQDRQRRAESHHDNMQRLQRTMDVTHRIGLAVLEAKRSGRKTVRIADVVAEDERLGPSL